MAKANAKICKAAEANLKIWGGAIIRRRNEL